jgi:hypothetical protein
MTQILNINFKLFFKIFIILSLIIFLEGFLHYYSPLIGYVFGYLGFFNYYGQGIGYNKFIWNENGFIELFQVSLLFISIIYFLKILNLCKRLEINLVTKIFIYLYFFGLIYYFFEEISWGQHFFGWGGGSFFNELNNQKETNIHNISNLFNELPRGLLILWCSFSFLLVDYIRKINKKNVLLELLILPSRNLKYISIYFLIFFLPDFIFDKLNIYPPHLIHAQKIQITDIVDFVTFNFIKLSEYQELILCIYIFSHSFYLRKYLLTFKTSV